METVLKKYNIKFENQVELNSLNDIYTKLQRI